jgi:hypothetical protein
MDGLAFLSPHGLRALSKRHSTPYQVSGVPGATIEYEPAESHTAMYGGNSNWRGPVWFPINYLVIRALLQYDQFFWAGIHDRISDRSGQQLSLRDIAGDLSDRLISIWLPGLDGRRPVYGGVERMQTDQRGKTTCCSTSTSTAITAPAWEPCIKPAGPRLWLICCSTRRVGYAGWSSTTMPALPPI